MRLTKGAWRPPPDRHLDAKFARPGRSRRPQLPARGRLVRILGPDIYGDIRGAAATVRWSDLNPTLARLPMLANKEGAPRPVTGYLGAPRIRLFLLSRYVLADFLLATTLFSPMNWVMHPRARLSRPRRLRIPLHSRDQRRASTKNGRLDRGARIIHFSASCNARSLSWRRR
jgi:hypothetical protein